MGHGCCFVCVCFCLDGIISVSFLAATLTNLKPLNKTINYPLMIGLEEIFKYPWAQSILHCRDKESKEEAWKEHHKN